VARGLAVVARRDDHHGAALAGVVDRLLRLGLARAGAAEREIEDLRGRLVLLDALDLAARGPGDAVGDVLDGAAAPAEHAHVLDAHAGSVAHHAARVLAGRDDARDVRAVPRGLVLVEEVVRV